MTTDDYGGMFFIGGTNIVFIDCVGARFYWGVISNNWGHDYHFLGQGFNGGDYQHSGAQLLEHGIYATVFAVHAV